MKIIENKAEKLQYIEPKRSHLKLSITIIFKLKDLLDSKYRNKTNKALPLYYHLRFSCLW